MRSVKVDRKRSRRGAAPKASRRSAVGSRIPADRLSSGKRKNKHSNPVSRLADAVKAKLTLRRPMLLITAGGLLLVMVAGLFIGGYVGRTISAANRSVDDLIADAGFGISAVHMSGYRHTPPKSIISSLGFSPGQPIFSADTKSAQLRLQELPWVAHAEVRRRYPDDISVSIVEKVPFALWQAPDGSVNLVERSGGVIISNEGLEPFAKLPVLIGDGAAKMGAELIAAVAAHHAVAARVKAMERISGRRWNLDLEDGVVVQLPEANWKPQLDALEYLIVDKGVLERDIGTIDLRSPDNYIFILRNGQQEQKPAKGKAT
ncbi:MAG TPA: FtsQ-type POTRA domain-containing protein [Rhizomicrobium sp.]|jgi:cell division protein FtsQ|nr:FtsQ-type POTRA domain-containing protein [Rhizomicrobium sp.]